MTDITTPFPATPHKLGLYPVVDSVEWIARLLEAGVTTIQLRIKDLPDEQVEEDIAAAIALGRRYQARLFINDYWRLAIKHGAYGVHLGQEDLDTTDLAAIHRAGLRLGVSTHDDAELARAGGETLLHRAGAHLPHPDQRHAFGAAGAGGVKTPHRRFGGLPDGGDRRDQYRSRTGGAGVRRRQRGGGQRHHPGAGLARGDGRTAAADRR